MSHDSRFQNLWRPASAAPQVRLKADATSVLKPLVLVALTLGAVVRVAAETHTFIPQAFYNTYSFAHPPALRIKPGDRVITKTADASGVDWNGKTVAQGPNPQTGPFFIEGAEPGDMIAVTFTKMEINRATAY